MLFPYKSAQRKIAMGLISFMPKEKEIKKLQKTIDLYEKETEWELFLWKVEDDYVAVIGVCHLANGDAELHHLGVNPSFRQEGLGKRLIEEVKRRLEGRLLPTKETRAFFDVCQDD
ncbi:GNAT family N-acetyltransferase [Halalkalibacterium halodurans]|uniref:Reductase (Riboflavin biosynthesis) n=1 Tax=Halalkalibacterium halodurans (strain ATCC BAA-125 / DSM 18197 / FERM 7344 / JCM 9153 / C-125) TaxID=272558 RepID=Q9KCL3_HALH5|nr:GNAT family N-acetyltransferase [Halalkalibacterium halodurans]MDY7222131.1 GNAT family N-acetyltransferase [Halalkalibacterium halodurans]MDY7241352.1 GNAT family N-acetyltransferase [Halalkalibacterium halodurans]MED4081868.1 GNAT family N-acetyltransferase [Halalkalibacterium halodurans]MED4086395.1 GNAT family N-acetyltransferase [Halalkalibacterium halodurans]MED4105069.1 GNAT family N-acetyltransferase [Halalkalibacterium halodurans]